MKRLSAIGCTALLTTHLASAQVRVAGRVVNETNAPVSGAQVILGDVPFTTSVTAVSDPTGAFALHVPAAGDYTLKVDREGFYVIADRTITITSATSEIHITLQSVHEMEASINVSGKAGVVDMDRVAPQETLSSRTL